MQRRGLPLVNRPLAVANRPLDVFKRPMVNRPQGSLQQQSQQANYKICIFAQKPRANWLQSFVSTPTVDFNYIRPSIEKEWLMN